MSAQGLPTSTLEGLFAAQDLPSYAVEELTALHLHPPPPPASPTRSRTRVVPQDGLTRTADAAQVKAFTCQQEACSRAFRRAGASAACCKAQAAGASRTTRSPSAVASRVCPLAQGAVRSVCDRARARAVVGLVVESERGGVSRAWKRVPRLHCVVYDCVLLGDTAYPWPHASVYQL